MTRILIFAETELAKQLSAVLTAQGYNTICCSDEQQALCQVITFAPQLVLAEYLDLDGEWLCREIRKLKQGQQTEIIMMSGAGSHLSDKDMEAMVLSFGANGYLRKPFIYSEIGNYAKSWLRAS